MNIVGSDYTGCAKVGDLCTVSICVNGSWTFALAIITGKLDRCIEWAIRGGKEWKHNFTVKFLTPPISQKDSPDEFSFLIRACEETGCNKTLKGKVLTGPQIICRLFSTNRMQEGANKTRFLNVWKRYLEKIKFLSI